MAYGESNGHMTDDGWRNVTPKGHNSKSQIPLRLEPNISKIAGDAI